jgi:Xaa-Pro dipeptidase
LYSRRRFLQTGSMVAAVPALLSNSASANDSNSLPPAIAALGSMKGEAKPITVEERAARQEKARQLMRDNNLSAILLAQGTSLVYFTGIKWWGGERLFAMVLPAKGDAFYVAPAFEEGRAREQIALAPEGKNPDVRVWQEDESPYTRVAQGLSDRGLAAGTIGFEETVKFVFSDNIRKAAASASFTSATPVTSGCRMIKSVHEIDLMRLAAKVTLAAYEATHRSLKAGMTRKDVESMLETAHRQLGVRGRRGRTGRRILRLSAWDDSSAGNSRRNDCVDRRRLLGGGVCLGYNAHVCSWESERQDEAGVRHCSPCAEHGARNG